jgi:hypothetical protein
MWTTTERRTKISLSPPSTPRLRLRPAAPPGSARTALDGAWWPRSADPVAELPGLILALQDHGPRRLRVDGPADTRVVRLSWFDSLPSGLLTAIHADGRRVDLFTVPAATPHTEAEASMELASDPHNLLHTPGLLAVLTPPPGRTNPASTPTVPESVWGSEGGRLRQGLAAR